MGIKKTGGLPARLEGLRRRFERWRGTHKARSRIPEAFWGSAARMAGRYGLHRTAKTLRLDYYALKKRVEHGTGTRVEGVLRKRAEVPKKRIEVLRKRVERDVHVLAGRPRGVLAGRPEQGVAAFVELTPSSFIGACECTLDLENADGAKMRVHLKSATMPDLAALSQSFWNARP